MMPGLFEMIIILVIVLHIFGGKRLKSLGTDLGTKSSALSPLSKKLE